MLTSSTGNLALIADPDPIFLKSILRNAEAFSTKSETVTTMSDLEMRLKVDPARYSGIFLNPRLCYPLGIPLIKTIRAACPATPIFLIMDEAGTRLKAEDSARLTVRDTLEKPLTSLDIHNALMTSRSFDPKATIALAGDDVALLDVEFDEGDEHFVPIRAKSFMAGRDSYFDIYVRLNACKYVKILTAGDSFEPGCVHGYLEKGVEKFYLRKKAQENYLKYCDTLTTAVLSKENIAPAIKVSQVMNWGEETSSFLRNGGLNEGAVLYARRFTKSVHGLVKELKLDQFEAIQRHLNGHPHFDHSVTTVMIASLLAIPLKMDSARSTSIVGLAALLHDIGLESLPKEIQAKREEEMTPDELELYQTHPFLGMDILRRIPGIDPVVIQAVGQHHERRTGKGYPGRLGANSINLVSETIGLSEELVIQMERAVANPALNVAAEMERLHSDGFSSSVFTTLKILLR